jgi:hypothetical protein
MPAPPAFRRLLLLGCALALPAVLRAQDEFERAPIRYSATPAGDRMAALQERLADGTFEFDRSGDEKAYLLSVLKALEVSPASQILVFSRTSLQVARINPQQPRALYFSDDCYVGWVPGGDVEVITTDSPLGAVFYRLHVPRAPGERSRAERDGDCLRCHAGLQRDRLPGLLVRSVTPDERGEPIATAGSHFTDFTSPLRERWGGWYVTGRHGAMRHLGNVYAATATGAVAVLDVEAGANRLTLPDWVDATPYPRARSDIAALMIFEHQVTVHNAIIAAHYAARQTLYRNAELAPVFGYPTNELSATSRRLLESQADRLVQVLLNRGEFPLEDEGIEIDPEFAEVYAQGARRAADGRSLRDLQLLTRIYKYRCSPLIYSRAFAQLPERFRAMVLERLRQVLDGALVTPEERATYAYLKDSERARIRGILVETLPDLPATWRGAPVERGG